MRARSTTLARTLGCLLISLTAVATTTRGQERPAEDMRIHLKARVFDPLAGPGELPAALRLAASSATERRIVQFRAPLTRQQRELLRSEYGLKLTDYVPNLAYLERIPQETLGRLRRLDLVRATVDYQPAFKISPTIGKVKFRTEERLREPGLQLLAILFDDADPAAVAASIRSLRGVTGVELADLREQGGAARVRFVAPSVASLPEVARFDGVRWIEEVAEQIEDNGNTAGTIQSGTPGNEPVWDRSLHGEGQIVGVVDGGPVDINHCMFRDPVNNVPSPTHRKVLEVRGAGVSGHATFVAGIVLGDDFNNLGTGANRGNAWAARLVSGRRGEGMLNALTSNRARGATIHTNSWHDNTQGAGNPALYNQTAADADTFTWNNQDHLVLGSMGNNGEEQGPPGTAKNAVGVNAARRDPNEMSIGDGNPGPTADGRRKPDVVTPGCLISSAQVSTACTIQLSGACATSWATPAAAATAALIRQYYAEGFYPSGTARPANAFSPTGALLKATLLNGTIDMTGPGLAGYPTNNEGWGLARLDDVLFFPGSPRHLRAFDVRHASGLASGESQAFSVNVAASAEPLKVTLVWTEPPAAAGAAVATVNNLNLTVIAPDGTSFFGNVFAGGQSVAGGVADAVNNVEQVLVNAPAVGIWTIRVSAPAVNVGQPDQGYAVVATATTSAPQIQVPGGAALGATCQGGASRATLPVCNTGRDDLVVQPITSSNPRFSVTTPSSGFPVTISHDFCFPFEVAFQPSGAGSQTGTLTIPTNDPAHPVTVVQVSGSGATPDVRVTGSTAFGVTSGWKPAEKTVSVCNAGACELSVAAVSTACADFAVAASPFPATLGAGACLDSVVEFTPTLPGRRSCGLSVASNDPDTPVVGRTLTARTPPFLSLHAGVVDPSGALASSAGLGSSFELGLVNPFRPRWAWELRVSRARFDGTSGQPDTRALTLRAGARFTFNPAAPLRVFVSAGPTLFHFEPGDVEGGLSLGAGLQLPAGRRFAFEATYGYHVALTASPDLEWSQFQAGILISF